MERRLRRAAFAFSLAAVLGCTAAALIFSGAAAADSSPAGQTDGQSAPVVDPPLMPFASVPLTTPSGTIQSVIYDGANTTIAGSISQSFGGFTVPAAPFTATTTAIVADGQLPDNSFSFGGSGPALSDPNAFPGKPPCPAGWTEGCLWDTNTYDATPTFSPGDTSASGTIAVNNQSDCVTWVGQVLATGPSGAFAKAGYLAAGVALRDQGSGTINLTGIPAGSYIARAYLFWATINPSDPGGAMAIDGSSVTPSLDGMDTSPCWPPDSSQTIFMRSANVTPFVNGNGSYTISGYPTGLSAGENPFANPNANPFMEGATLVVFYGQASATGIPITSTEGAPFSGQVATFTEPDASAPATQYTSTIDWGDGTTTSGTVTGPVGGPFSVDGTHTYTEENSYPVKVTIADNNNPSNTQTATSTATVGDALLTGGPVMVTGGGVEGVTPSTATFTFTDANSFAPASDFTAKITWGDGSTTTGVMATGPMGGPFTVTGTHQYAEENTYAVGVSVLDDGGSMTSGTGMATVADAPLGASCATPTVSVTSFSGTVATFTDANPGGTVADFTATIDWGDGTTTAGTVTGPTGGPFTVTGTHTFATLGSHTINVAIADDGGSTAKAAGCSVLVYVPVPFTIGDGNSATGTSVTFWGAQWWKLNTLSGGPAPASFKGFALKPASPNCGTNWTTGPGNSPPPPNGPLPSYIGLIVTSSVSQSGSTISGNTVSVVVVKTNPGYNNDPGHAGSGTVVAVVC